MEIIKCWEEGGELIPEPFKRTIKVFYGPDKRNVPECNFTQAIIYPGYETHYHLHDRPELIYVISGRGIAVSDNEEYPIEADVVFWVPANVMHKVKNTGDDMLKLATVFIPGYSSTEHLGRLKKAAEDAQS